MLILKLWNLFSIVPIKASISYQNMFIIEVGVDSLLHSLDEDLSLPDKELQSLVLKLCWVTPKLVTKLSINSNWLEYFPSKQLPRRWWLSHWIAESGSDFLRLLKKKKKHHWFPKASTALPSFNSFLLLKLHHITGKNTSNCPQKHLLRITKKGNISVACKFIHSAVKG